MKKYIFAFAFVCLPCVAVYYFIPTERPRLSLTVPPISPVRLEHHAAWEREEICCLTAYSLVFKNWQTEQDNPGRGHNIGAILVSPTYDVVAGDINCNYITKNTTNHAEVRTITSYLKKSKVMDLKGYTIYTTLEPCAMCSGMMTQSQVAQVVYGQTDPAYGKALERLQLDSSKFGGFPPYPRPVKSTQSCSSIRFELDQAYSKQNNKSITSWLRTTEAEEIYAKAYQMWFLYQPVFTDNNYFLMETRKFLTDWKLSP